MAPGPRLGAILASLHREALSGHDLVVVLRARARQVAYEQAQLHADMAEIAHCADPGHERSIEILEYAADEIRAALSLTRRAAEDDLSFALQIRERLPRIWGSLASGAIDLRRARTIWHQVRHLPSDIAGRIVDEIIQEAPSLTTGQLRSRIQKLAIDIDPEQAKTRYEGAHQERRLVAESNPQGTANIFGLDLSPHRVGRAMRLINRIARHLKQAGDTRSIDQIRADVFIDLLIGGGGQSSDGGVVIKVDLRTLVELDDRAGQIPGYGPVISDIARQVAAEEVDGEWRWVATHPDTGAVLADGTTRRRPTASQRRHIETRDETCAFPGCRMPAADCDLDHLIDWACGGQTLVDNLPSACRHDHNVKHRGRWRYRRLHDGHYEWTSRLGHTYVTKREPP